MDALTLAFIGWGFLAVLFLICTFFIRKNLVFIIVLNLIFNIVGYVTVSQTMGVAKPLEYSIPLYKHENWDKDGVHIFGYYNNSKTIYLLIDESVPRLYSMPYDEDFINDLKKAIERADGDIRQVKIIPKIIPKMYYGNWDTSSHVSVQNYSVKKFDPKAIPPNSDTNTYETH